MLCSPEARKDAEGCLRPSPRVIRFHLLALPTWPELGQSFTHVRGPVTMLHFQLLSDHELKALRPLLKNLGEQSDRIVEDWYRRYATHFGEVRGLSEAEFSDVFSPFLRCGKLAL